MSKKKKSAYNTASDTTSSMIYNLAASVFRWTGLPYEMAPPSEMLELLLVKHGHLACFNTNLGPMILPCTMSRLNQWGLQAEGSAKPIITGRPGIRAIPYAEGKIAPIVIYDQPSHNCIMESLEWYTEALGKLKQAIDTCTHWLKTPMLFIGSEEQEDIIISLVNKIEAGVPAVAIAEGSLNVGGIVLTPTNVTPSILDALHMSYSRIEAKLFEELGVPDYNTQKMAQQTRTEILLPMMAVALKTLSRLQMRRYAVDRINEIYGTEISVQALSLGLIEQSIFSSTGYAINLQDLDGNGIPDKLEVKQDE